MDEDTKAEQSDETKKQPLVQVPKPSIEDESSLFIKLRHGSAWAMIISAIVFALIGILATWSVFGPSTNDIVWRSFSSLAIIAFASLIVNVASRMVERNVK
jgi:hypothetical protein